MAKKSPSEACRENFEALNKAVKFTGLHIYENNVPGPLYKAVRTVLTGTGYLAMAFTSIIQYSDNMPKMTMAILSFIMAIQGCVKILMQIIYKEHTAQLIHQACDFIAKFEDNPKVCKVSWKYVNFCNRFRPLIQKTYLAVGVCLFSLCLIVSYFTKKLTIPYGAVLPYIDPESYIGFSLNMVIFSSVFYHGTIGYFATEYAFLSLLAMGCGQIETAAVACNELTDYLQEHGTGDNRKVDEMIAEIIKILQIHTKFMRQHDDVYGFHSFAIIFSSMVSIAIALFEFIQETQMFGMIMIVVFIWQISALCIVGEVYMMTVDKVQIKVNGMDFYLMPWKKQKMAIGIIHITQSLVAPSAWAFFPLNFETLIKCIKAMYQFLMLLLNVSDE